MHLDNCTAKKRFKKRPVAKRSNWELEVELLKGGKAESEHIQRFDKNNWSQDQATKKSS